eukprot:CAMPEP_0181229348 /NCGR_PEP_ID=MMETSP1096-20121128/33845_1 /TAXON_ID=156174 ORGANISM="Chrysochromulina ericina, Strain CCMP281" /NCGR_SAMPLE_ID=MMETSP1096 /ASSEMBLY_ACC=CAM_ASM_000453 /LENGTH=112 /DNA_ID=CAMNT_0023322957 /DNA_START=302 /DNA_END=641 /DNA_ORIENTATION=+
MSWIEHACHHHWRLLMGHGCDLLADASRAKLGSRRKIIGGDQQQQERSSDAGHHDHSSCTRVAPARKARSGMGERAESRTCHSGEIERPGEGEVEDIPTSWLDRGVGATCFS